MNLLFSLLEVTSKTRVLDVGGSIDIWQHARVQPNLTILNFPSAIQNSDDRTAQVGGDGCMLPFRDNEFDLVFSNSVIEHVGSADNQGRFAREVARVGRRFWVQTPNKAFPIEQHLLLPFVHQMPPTLRRLVVRRVTGWEILTRPTQEQRQFYIDHCLHELRLLRIADLQNLFPDAQVISEKAFGLTKSLIAVRT